MVKNSLLKYLQSIHFGRLTLELPDQTIHQFGNNGPEAFLKINNYKASLEGVIFDNLSYEQYMLITKYSDDFKQ